MTITLNSEQEHAIQEAIDAGLIQSADELIDSAIARLPRAGSHSARASNLFELFEPLRGLLADEEIDHCFSRNPGSGRQVDLA
jgi:hypothetical protein